MRVLSSLLITSLIAMATPAMAADASKQVAIDTPPTTENTVREAHTMFGNIAIANMSLMNGLDDEATIKIHDSLEIVRKLEAHSTQFNSDLFVLGKISYKSASNQFDYYVPILNDTFTLGAGDGDYLKQKSKDYSETDAQVVNTSVALDLKKTREMLENAYRATIQKKYADAQNALMGATNTAFISQSVSDVAMVTIRQNLVLAHELAKSKDFQGVGFALKHVQDAIKNGKEQASKLVKIQKTISALQADLTKSNATASAPYAKRIADLIGDFDATNK